MERRSAISHRAVPGVEEVLRDIAHYRHLIRQAETADPAAGRAARVAYRPFLSRRLKLLCALRDGRAEAWREYPADAVTLRHAGERGPIEKLLQRLRREH